MAQQYIDIVITQVPLCGDRFNMARILEDFLQKQMAENEITKKNGELSFVDIPLRTNENDHKCMAFLRFLDTIVHPWFVSKFNGIHVTKSDRLTISISKNSPMTFSSRYLNSQIAWVHPKVLARHSCTENKVSSNQTITEKSYATNTKSAAKQLEIAIQNTKPETKSILTSFTDHTPDHQSPALVQISSPKVANRLELQNLASKLLLAETKNTKLKQIIEELKTLNLVFSSESAKR